MADTVADTVAGAVAGAELADNADARKVSDLMSGVVAAGADWLAGSAAGSAGLPSTPDRPAWGCATTSSMTGVGAASVVVRSPASRTSSPWGWEGTRASLSPVGSEPPTTEAWIASAPPVTNSPVPEVVRSSRPESAASLRYQGDQVPFSLTRR